MFGSAYQRYRAVIDCPHGGGPDLTPTTVSVENTYAEALAVAFAVAGRSPRDHRNPRVELVRRAQEE
jgi:hypothetical protein